VSPAFSPEIRFPAEGRAAPGIGRFTALVPPGTYTVKIAAAGQELSQSLTVRKDPNSGGSESEIGEQTTVVAEVTRDVNSAVDMINALEVLRAQLATIKSSLSDDTTKKDVQAATDSMDKKLVAVEERLFQTRVTGRGQDLIRWPFRVTEQLMYLAGSVASSDHAPTAQHREVQTLLAQELRNIRAQFDQVISRDLEAFKQMLRQRNIQNVIISN
jgi:hypothetical protein